jgi:site-specific recombinase XerD
MVEIFTTDKNAVTRLDSIPGVDPAAVRTALETRLLMDGQPIFLDEAMRPVEPVSSWFRSLALGGLDPKTMKAYGYSIRRLLVFLRQRGANVLSATETDLLEFRYWRTQAQAEPIGQATWERESAAINGLYEWLVDRRLVKARPWRTRRGGRDSYRGGVSRDMRIRHLSLEQYLFLRDVGFGGVAPDARLDSGFRGRNAHRNRAAAELALLTGMQLQEWSTLLLPELGIEPGTSAARRPGDPVEFSLRRCAKYGSPRPVYVPFDALAMVDRYMLLERTDTVRTAQPTLKRRRDELFVINGTDSRPGKVRGVLDGVTVTRSIANLPPELRRITVVDTGDGLEPLALFLGAGGRMLLPSSWDKARWAAWQRMCAYAGHEQAPVLPATPWLFHDYADLPVMPTSWRSAWSGEVTDLEWSA